MEQFQQSLTTLERINIRLAGWGGQGILLMGFIFGDSVIKQGLYAVQTQQYGPESRGTPVKSDLVISTKSIQFPLFKAIDILIAMNQESYSQQYSQVRPGGLILIDSSLVNEFHESSMLHGIPAQALSTERFKSKQLANMIMLGFLQKKLAHILEEPYFVSSIRETVPKKFMSQDLDAFLIGKSWEKDNPQYCNKLDSF